MLVHRVSRVLAVATLAFAVSFKVFADNHVEPSPLNTNGGFESVDADAEATSPPDVSDTDTFPEWRFFNLDSANVSFTATITDHASVGVQALRLSVDNTGGSSSYALDQWEDSMHTSIETDAAYIVSFDAAWVAGVATDNLLFQLQEFDEAGVFLGNGIARTVSVGATEYATFDMVYRPVHPDAAEVGFAFGPMRGRTGATTIDIDNIQLKVATAPVNGDFEIGPDASAGGTGEFVDTTSFPGWRLFSVGSPPITGLTGTLVDAAEYQVDVAGGRALRLEVTNTGSPSSHDYGLDNDNARIPVALGETYTFSFEAALVGVTGGSLTLNASVSELDAGGAYNGFAAGITPTLVEDRALHRYSVDYTISDPNVTQVLIAFRPVTTGESVLVIDNVRFAPLVNPAPPMLTFEVAGDQLNLIWPESSLGWLLQSNDADVGDTAGWEDVPGTSGVTEQSVPLQPGSPNTFYRLRFP